MTEEAQTIVTPDNSTWSDLLPAVGPDLQPAAVTEPQPPALLVPAEGPELRQSGWTRRPPVREKVKEGGSVISGVNLFTIGACQSKL